ncbi:MAG TPA: hypothetical protein VHT73_13585 [Thermodesulfobacteriota bacterium]|nr:hypothetical protein [Thermodesulfobacteriota bacterium]
MPFKLLLEPGLSVKLLRPQNKLEESILNDPEFQKGIDYGTPDPDARRAKYCFILRMFYAT